MPQFSGGTQLLNAQTILERVGVEEKMKVGDLGCGSAGHFSIPAARMVGPKGIVYSVDILKSALQGVESRAKLEGVFNIQTIWSNLEIIGATKVEADSLDIVFIISVLFQTKEHENMAREASRLLKKNGKLLIIDWKKTNTPLGPPVVDRVSKEEIREIIKKVASFEFKEEFKAGEYHYGLIFIKK